MTSFVKSQIPIYRYQEVREAIAAGRPIFVVEGEGVCDTLWELGLAATTTLGGSGKYRTYGSYEADLEGALLVLSPDRDVPGLEHMSDIFKDFPDAKWLYAPPSDFYWTHLPKSGGIDVADWVRDGATAEMIMEAIEDRQSVVDDLNQAFKSPDAKVNRTRSERKQMLNSLSAYWGESLRFNEMTLSPELDGKPMNLDCLSIQIADEFDLDIGQETANQILLYLAKKNPYHPIRDYLTRIASEYRDTPENQQLFNAIATRYFGTDEPLYDAFMSKTMIGAVHRIFEPGCKFDTICTLQGKQGLRKSTFWEKLAIEPDWFDDGLSSSNTSDKDEKLKLRSSWILELAEIESLFKKKEVSSFRGFVTSKNDSLRVPYGRSIQKFPRTSIFVGSVNPTEFLVDPEGHRRYWIIPVKCDRIPTELLEKERDLLWAMAFHAYNRNETSYLNHEQERRNALLNKRYEVCDSWQEVIECWLENQSETTVSNLLSDCLKLEVGRHDRQSQMRVCQILKALDWEKQEKRRVNGQVTQIWRGRNRSQQGRNGVATEVATPFNPCISIVSDEVLLPKKEKYTKTSEKNESVVFTEEKIEKTLLPDLGRNVATQVTEPPNPQALEPVATPVATCCDPVATSLKPLTSTEPMDEYDQAKQSVLASQSKEEVKAVTANWNEEFRKQVGSTLSQEELTALRQLPETKPSKLTVDDFESGQRVKFNRAAAKPDSAARIPEDVEQGEIVKIGPSTVQVQWEGLSIVQFHQPIDLLIVEKDG